MKDGRHHRTIQFHPLWSLLSSCLIAISVSACGQPEAPPEQKTPPAADRPPLTRLEIAPLASPLTVGDSRTLTVTATDADQTARPDAIVTWTSEKPGIVSVSPQGTVTAIAPGVATVIAASQGISASIQITVGLPAVKKLEIQPSVISLTTGDSQQLQVIATDSDGRNIPEVPITWKSSNPAAATVDPEGRITAQASGTATILASSRDKSASVRVTVSRPGLARLEIRPGVASGGIGDRLQLKALAIDAKGNERPDVSIGWKSDHPEIAEVSPSGTVTLKSPGTVTIIASADANTASAAVTVLAPPVPSAKPSHEDIKARYKGADPSQLVYLSGITGEIAGTGDPSKYAGEAEQAGLGSHPLALELADLPKDRYGLIDWAAAIRTGKVKPRSSLESKTPPEEPPLKQDVVIFTKSLSMDDVIFPHYVHTLWLACTNCHPALFPMDAKEANRMMTMPKIAAGEFCGRCHNRVAFPLSDCLRCHVKPKDTPPIDPNYQTQAHEKSQ